MKSTDFANRSNFDRVTVVSLKIAMHILIKIKGESGEACLQRGMMVDNCWPRLRHIDKLQ